MTSLQAVPEKAAEARTERTEQSDGEERSIPRLYYEAYVCVDKGIHFDQLGKVDTATTMYRCGLEVIDAASMVPGASTSELYQKMVKARSSIEERLKFLEHNADVEPLSVTAVHDENAELLFEIPDGVQIFFITSSETSVPSYPSSLKIFSYFKPMPVTIGPGVEMQATGFLQVDTWVYPFIVGQSPVLETTYGAYIFPYCYSTSSDVKVGLILPVNLEKDVLGVFEDILQGMTCLRHQTVPPTLTKEEEERFSSKLARFLVKGGSTVASSIRTCADVTSEFIAKGADRLQDKVGTEDAPVVIDPRIRNGVRYLRKGSRIVVKISGFLVKEVGKAAEYLGRKLIMQADKKIGLSRSGSTVLKDVAEVTIAGVAGASAVWLSLEDATKILAKSIANGTVKVVHCRYGESAAGVTDDCLSTAGNAAYTAWNVDQLGVKAIAKRTTAAAGMTAVKEIHKQNRKE